jgi:hypothetical protein
MNHEDEENPRLTEELALLRQSIMRAEPSVMLDGRFEEMIITPLSVIIIARELISQIPAIKATTFLV